MTATIEIERAGRTVTYTLAQVSSKMESCTECDALNECAFAENRDKFIEFCMSKGVGYLLKEVKQK